MAPVGEHAGKPGPKNGLTPRHPLSTVSGEGQQGRRRSRSRPLALQACRFAMPGVGYKKIIQEEHGFGSKHGVSGKARNRGGHARPAPGRGCDLRRRRALRAPAIL